MKTVIWGSQKTDEIDGWLWQKSGCRGDGALSEAVTGLLRRPDNVSAAQHFPISIISVGKKNNAAKLYFKDLKVSYLFLINVTSKKTGILR